jgi:hypothetical protein
MVAGFGNVSLGSCRNRGDIRRTLLARRPRGRNNPSTSTIVALNIARSKPSAKLQTVTCDLRRRSHATIPNRDIYIYPARGPRISRAKKKQFAFWALPSLLGEDDIEYRIGRKRILTPEAVTRQPSILADIWS